MGMIHKEQLYQAFGELIYAVAKADGLVQNEEVDALKKILQRHAWAKDVQWSFDYELKNENDLQYVYEKALDTFRQYGPTPEYVYLIQILEEVARASDGIDSKEKALIHGFQDDLKERFIRDLDSGDLKVAF
ncbi:MAG: TerB family tellurite resistance protein [Microscillaceae bacterium]|nr:TerB family tellurite resistance protein [Microscillaceae bacterium]